MKVILKTVCDGKRLSLTCESMQEALTTANILANENGFAIGDNSGQPGDDRYKLNGEDPLIIASLNQIILEFGCGRMSAIVKPSNLGIVAP